MLMQKQRVKGKPISLIAQDIIHDVDNIREIMESETGMNVSKTNVIRACLKVWYDVNNYG
jgi:hypothetical protein